MLKLRPYLVVLFLGCLSFGATVRIGFIWDDHEMIVRNDFIKEISASSLKHAFTHDVFDGKGDPYYRPVQTLFNMLDYKLWGLNPTGYHVTNLLFHLLSALLLLFLFRSLFDEKFAFLVASFFVVHPVIVEQLIIIAGRAELLAMLLTLAALVFCLKKTPWAYGLAAGCYVLACFSKESGVMFPAFLMLLGWLDKKIRAPLWAYGIFGFVFVVYFWIRSQMVSTPELLPFKDILIVFIRDLPTIFLEYIRIILFPIDLHSHRRMVFAKPFMLLSPFLFLLFAALAALKRSRWAAFGAGWFLIGMLPKVPNFLTSSLMLDHWGYLSAIGIFVLIARGLLILAERSTQMRVLAGALFSGCLCFWMLMSWMSIFSRGTDFQLYRHALRYPSSSVVRGNLALLYFQNGYIQEAEKLIDEALEINPHNAQALLLREKIRASRPHK